MRSTTHANRIIISTLNNVLGGLLQLRPVLTGPSPLTAEEEAALVGELADVADPGEALRDG